MGMLRNLYGSALPARMQLDKQILSRCMRRVQLLHGALPAEGRYAYPDLGCACTGRAGCLDCHRLSWDYSP